MKFSVAALTLCSFLLCVPRLSAQTFVHVPDNTPDLTLGNTIPFGSANYTYMVRIPATLLSVANTKIDEIALLPAFTNTWTPANVLIGFGHLPNPIVCPFTFPGPGAATIGGFLDFTVSYDSAVHGPFSWPCTNNVWSPLGLAAVGGSNFIWNGVDDVGFYITYSGGTGGGSIRRSPTGTNFRTYAASYQAGTSTACSAFFGAYLRLTVSPSAGLFANFTPQAASGPAALTVNFTDTSFTSDPGGVTLWAWDFDGDSLFDSFVQHPTHTYLTPGSYPVTLYVADSVHPPSSKTVVNAINVGPYQYQAATTGGGVGDLLLTPVPSIGAPNATRGFTFVSFLQSNPLGSGPAFGLQPDSNFWAILFEPAAVGNPLHYLPFPGVYPDAQLFAPPGALSFLAGVTTEFVQVGITAQSQIAFVSNVARITF